MTQTIAIAVIAALLTTGCASAGRTPIATTGPRPNSADTRTMAEYVQRLAAGSKVRVERTDGTAIRGTLLSTTDDRIVVQKNTRIPEPPIEVPIAELARVTTENSGGMGAGKAVAIGIASGVGAFFAIVGIALAMGGD